MTPERSLLHKYPINKARRPRLGRGISLGNGVNMQIFKSSINQKRIRGTIHEINGERLGAESPQKRKHNWPIGI